MSTRRLIAATAALVVALAGGGCGASDARDTDGERSG